MKKLMFVSLMIAGSFAQAAGFQCTQQLGPFDGPKIVFKLAQAVDGSFASSITVSSPDGSSPVTTTIGSNMSCTFSAKNPILALCQSNVQPTQEHFVVDYMEVTKNSWTRLNPYGEGDLSGEDYAVKMAAPALDAKTIRMLSPLMDDSQISAKELDLSYGVGQCQAI